MADPIDWQARAEHFRSNWRQERRRRRRTERTLEKLLRLDRKSCNGDKALEQLVNLFQEMTREALAHSTA